MTLSPSQRLRCYVASPLGFSEAGREYYRDFYLPALSAVVEPVDPWALISPGELAAARAGGRERELMLAIGRRNSDVLRTCAILAAYLDGQELDAGTVAELGFAAALGLVCFGLRTDLRTHGEPAVTVNLQVETFIVDSGGSIASSLGELVDLLRKAAARIARTD